MNILAIDQSTKRIGWAAQVAGKVESSAQTFVAPKENFQNKHLKVFWEWFNQMLDLQEPRLVVFEEPFIMRQGAAQMPLFGLRALLVTACELRGIEVKGVPPASLKKWATGNGRAEKDEMKAAAKERFPYYIPEEDPGADEGDALLLLAWGQGRPDLQVMVEKPKKKRQVKKTL